jgi:hypothetical protein
MSAIFARLNYGRNSAVWMQAAKKRLEFVLRLWDDNSVMRLTDKLPAGRGI